MKPKVKAIFSFSILSTELLTINYWEIIFPELFKCTFKINICLTKQELVIQGTWQTN